MAELFASGHIVDIILALILAEYAALRIWLRGRSAALGFEGTLLSGAFLLLALRAALADDEWIWVAFALACALAVHLFDLYRRLTKQAG